MKDQIKKNSYSSVLSDNESVSHEKSDTDVDTPESKASRYSVNDTTVQTKHIKKPIKRSNQKKTVESQLTQSQSQRKSQRTRKRTIHEIGSDEEANQGM